MTEAGLQTPFCFASTTVGIGNTINHRTKTMNLDQLNRANDLAGQLRGVKYKIESLLSSVTNNEVSLIEVLTGTSHDGEIVARIRDEETLKRISGEILQSFIESRARLEAELESLGVECRED